MTKNNKFIKIVVSSFIFTLIPSVFSFASRSSSFLDKLKDNGIIGSKINIISLKDVLLLISILLTFLLLGVKLSKAKIEKEVAIKQRDKLLKMNKDILINSLAKELGKEYLNIDIRIFIPRFTLINRLKKILGLKYRKEFIIRNINHLADPGNTNNLTFEVYPNPQGLVGECYNTKYMIYDTDLENTNSEKYNLSSSQINKTCNLKFSLCCPIFNNDEVIGILALDSKHTIEIEKSQKDLLRNSIVTFSQSIYEHIPQLFKPIGGIV